MPKGGEKQEKIAMHRARRARDNQTKEASSGIDLEAAYHALLKAYERERRRNAKGR